MSEILTRPIAVTGCMPQLPLEFPLSKPENAGNLIHANAPLRIFPSSIYVKDPILTALGYKDQIKFVNDNCSHLVITLANTLRLGDVEQSKYSRTIDYLSQIKKPIVVFGLGVQSKDENLEKAELPPSAIEFVRFLSQKAPLLGVRGQFTKAVVEKLCGISNAYVTGCPSLFSNLEAFHELRGNLSQSAGRPSYTGTRFFETEESRIFQQAIEFDHWLIEPVNKLNHKFYLDSCRDSVTPESVPYHFKYFDSKKEFLELKSIEKYFKERYRLFRDWSTWNHFNRELVSYSYGTRFHVNMAALISGKPALWITHDARTRELTNFMNLPAIPMEKAVEYDFNQPISFKAYEKFFDNFGGLLLNFNTYLQTNGLPTISMK